jgi:hypothetical protein
LPCPYSATAAKSRAADFQLKNLSLPVVFYLRAGLSKGLQSFFIILKIIHMLRAPRFFSRNTISFQFKVSHYVLRVFCIRRLSSAVKIIK